MLRELARQKDGPNEKGAMNRLGYANSPLKWRPRRVELFNKLFDLAAEANQNPAILSLRGQAEVMLGMASNLGDVVLKRLERSIHAAREVENFNAEWDLLQYQKLLLLKQDVGRSVLKKKLAEIQERCTLVRMMDKEVKDLLDLKDLIPMDFRKYGRGSKEVVVLIGPSGAPQKHLSAKAEIIAHWVQYNIALYAGDFEECVNCCERIAGLLRANRALVHDPMLQSVAIEHSLNKALFLIQLRRYKEADLAFQEYERYNTRKTDPASYRHAYFKYYLRTYTQQFDLEKGEQVIKEYEKILARKASNLNELFKIETTWLIIRFYLFVGEYSKAAFWSRMGFRNSLGEVRPILVGYFRITFIIAKFQLGEMEEVEAETQRTTAYFRRTGYQSEYTDCLLTGIGDATQGNGAQKANSLRSLKRKLAALGAQPVHHVIHQLFDLPLLIDAWLQGKAFKEVSQ
jgi:tetratricopeptide (TPR) repeat protein